MIKTKKGISKRRKSSKISLSTLMSKWFIDKLEENEINYIENGTKTQERAGNT